MDQQLDLDAIDTAADAATPGTWFAVELPPNEHHKHPAHWVKTEYDEGNTTSSQVVADCPWRQADAKFIAAMSPEVAKALVAEVRRLRAEQPEPEPEAIHGHFGLSYANYLVLPRTLLQSMDDQWQTRFVALLNEMAEAFQHVPQAEAYKVEAATEHIVNEMTEAELKRAGITVDWYRGETPPEGWSEEDLAEWRLHHEDPYGPTYSRDGEELDGHERVLLPAKDPVPHYNRGRTHIAPAARSAAV